MGWVMLAVIGAGAFVALGLFGAPRALWTLGAAALMLGATGYALQAKPGLAGAPVSASKAVVEDDAGVVRLRELRGAMFGRFTALDTAFYPADALIRSGKADTAAQLMLGAVRQDPQNAALWTWLGIAIVEADQGTMSPAAGVAFRRAAALAPQHPGPAFFYGMALARTGNPDAALPWLVRARRATPAEVSYRADIDRAIISIRFLAVLRARAMQGGTPAPAR
ncbi:tetratricopeptide (TPR) repeat protein [Sphingomonas sp. BE123]|uniref:tetratricopeptide repeat protein n=1 Tax=Sphingomonas sp. BE123 TaxID=2817842 RepID=UPI0028592448|nr:cytochrome c biogenesis factor-like protein [Sphingomonas sp. BE123]MDR6850895.1 tetratricopeptide (TPR) repeat protein [Sphingomonas sp. BE123]